MSHHLIQATRIDYFKHGLGSGLVETLICKATGFAKRDPYSHYTGYTPSRVTQLSQRFMPPGVDCQTIP